MGVVDLNGIRLRNRLVTSASLLGYGASKRRLILYGLSPIAQWVPLERFGAVTTRTMTLEPREGHFTLREDWGVTELPAMLRLYGKALRRVDAGWLLGQWGGCSTKRGCSAWIGCWSCARSTTSPRCGRSSGAAGCSRASRTPRSARLGGTGSTSSHEVNPSDGELHPTLGRRAGVDRI